MPKIFKAITEIWDLTPIWTTRPCMYVYIITQEFPMFYLDIGTTLSAGRDWGRQGCPTTPQKLWHCSQPGGYLLGGIASASVTGLWPAAPSANFPNDVTSPVWSMQSAWSFCWKGGALPTPNGASYIIVEACREGCEPSRPGQRLVWPHPHGGKTPRVPAAWQSP